MLCPWSRMPTKVSTSVRQRRKQEKSWRPVLEALEDRLVPSTFTVTNLNDSGAGSLRDAITQANATVSGSSGNTINFAVTGTITLESALPGLSNAVDISGPSAANLCVQRDSAAAEFRIFLIEPGITATISGLTIKGGDVVHNPAGGYMYGGILVESDVGGAICNVGNLTVSDAVITGNAADNGGAIDNAATLFVNNTLIAGNSGAAYAAGINNSPFYGDNAPLQLTIDGSTLEDNTNLGYYGGGIYATNTVVTINSSTFDHNTTADIGVGGGIDVSDQYFNRPPSTVIINSSTFTANVAGEGGGAIAGSNLTISNSSFIGNLVTNSYEGDGGAIASGGGLTSISGSTFADNSVLGSIAYGGAVYCGPLTVSNSTFFGNTAEFGAIYANGNATILSSTVDGNQGIGIEVAGYSSSLQIDNSIVAANSYVSSGTVFHEDVVANVNVAASFNNFISVGQVSVLGSGILVNGVNGNQVGTAANPLNPDLGPLQNNGGPTETMALLAGSPCINAGDNAYAPGPYDQRGPGYDRIVGGTIDIGAYEYGAAPNPPPVIGSISATPNPVTGTTTALNAQATDPTSSTSSLIYTWSVLSEPPGASNPTFSANGTNAAQNTVAAFHQAGSYTFAVTVMDPGGATATSDVSVTVDQTLTSLVVAPATASVADGASQQFTATADDQFGKALTMQPGITWSLGSGSLGSISGTGLYTAPASGTGAATVRASSGSFTGTASVTVVSVPTYVVTTLADSGTGSLRAAIAWADANPGHDVIEFAVTGTIALKSALPALTTNVNIEGPGANLLTVQGSGALTYMAGMLSINSGVTDSISGLTLAGGYGYYGGSIYNGGTLNLSNDVLANNAAAYYGGGVYNAGTLTVSDSTFMGNHAGYYGGAIEAASGTGTVISNSTFFGNSAGYYGGAISNLYGSLTVTNATIDGNTAYYGGGIYTVTSGTSSTLLRNTIVAANVSAYGYADVYGSVGANNSWNNLIGNGTGSNLVNGVNGNLVGTASSPINPLLGPLQNNGGTTPTQTLLAGSPAVDGGNILFAAATDQRGLPRVVNGTIDIGAYQV
jgi:predicted outer membrane repeat protein